MHIMNNFFAHLNFPPMTFTKSEAEVVPKPESEAEAEVDPESIRLLNTEAEPEDKSEGEVDPEDKSKADPEGEVDPKDKAEPTSEPKPEDKPEDPLRVQVLSSPLLERLAAYVAERKPKLYVLTPCFGGTCYVNYVRSMISTIELFQRLNFPIQFEFCKSDSLVTRARNNLIAKAMADTETTHMIFIDNDIQWNPLDILKLVLTDRGIVGGIYPLKRYNWQRLLPVDSVQNWREQFHASELVNVITEETLIKSLLLNYNINYLDEQLVIENNLARVRHIPAGFMMIRRGVIEALRIAYPETKYVDDIGYLSPKEEEHAYALFDCGVGGGHYLSEDWLFCERWRKHGGDVFADVSIMLTHSGVEDYTGVYLASLMQYKKRDTVPADYTSNIA